MSLQALALEYLKDHREVDSELASDLKYMSLKGMEYFYKEDPSSLYDMEYNSWDSPEWLDQLVDEYGVDGTFELLLESFLYYGHISCCEFD